MISDLMSRTQEKLSSLGNTGLFILAFSESSFNPIPVEVLLIPLCLASPQSAIWFGTIAVIGSVLGAMFGYMIGLIGKKAVLDKFFSQRKIKKVHRMYEKYESITVFIAGFTPIPYKLVTISAGVFYINFKKFVLMSIIGRGLRFYLEAILIMLYGDIIISFLKDYFGLVTILGSVFVIGLYLAYKKFEKHSSV